MVQTLSMQVYLEVAKENKERKETFKKEYHNTKDLWELKRQDKKVKGCFFVSSCLWNKHNRRATA